VTGSYAAVPGVTAWQGNNSAGQAKRAMAMALHIGIANFGGMIGAAVFRKQDSPRFLLGCEYLFLGVLDSD